MGKKIIILLLFLLAYFPLFLHLDSLSFHTYDEARLAVSAQEMVENGISLIPTFNQEPDMWSTKPALMIWLQTLSMKLFGVNELGARLPAALSAFFTIFLIGFFCWNILKRKYLGIFSVLVLLTTPGYIATHVSRTGDYDALLILFTTLFLLNIFELVNTKKPIRKKKLILWSALFLALAVLTKSVAGLLFLPAVLIYILWKKEGLIVLKSSQFYLGIGIFGLLVGGYYFTREVYNPGYLQAVWKNELGGRYLAAAENHRGPFLYYIENMWRKGFLPWLFFLPVAISLGWKKGGETRNLMSFLLICIFSFLLIVSNSETKLEWYVAPVYPLLALLTAIGIEQIFLLLTQHTSFQKSALLLLFAIAIFGMPYKNILASVYLPKHYNSMNYYAEFMKRKPTHQEFTIANIGYNAHILFYRKAYTEKGYKFEQRHPTELSVGERALLCEENAMDSLNANFEYKVIEEWKTCRLVEVTGRLH